MLPSGVSVLKWPHDFDPTADNMAEEVQKHGFKAYDLQTVPAWFFRDRHSHDHEEIRAAVCGVITFHFDDGPVTIEGGDILIIPGGTAHEVKVHNSRDFSAYKGSRSGERSVTEHADGHGSIEWIDDQDKS